MSQTPQNASTAITVLLPQGGSSVSVTSEPGSNLVFGFDPSTATASRSGNDLVFTGENGGAATVEGFFSVGDNSLPNLVLPDGSVVAAADFFSNSGLDLSTAAGPAATATPPGSGTSYDDNGGALIGGVDKFGMLGTDYWGRDTEYTDPYVGGIFGGASDLLLPGESQPPLGGPSIGDWTGAAVYERDTYLNEGTQGTNASEYGATSGHDSGRIEFSFGPNGQASDKPFSWSANVRDANGNPYMTRDADGNEIEIFWVASDDGLTLAGYAGEGGEKVISVEATLTEDGASYEVTLYGGIVHPAGGGDDQGLDLNLGFTVIDGNGNSVSGSVPVTVVDDELKVSGDSGQVEWTAQGEAVGADFAAMGDGEPQSSQGFTVSAGRVQYDENGNPALMSQDDVSGSASVWGGQGLGLAGSDYDGLVAEGKTRDKEINFENIDGYDTSEAIVFTLDNPASSLSVTLGQFYKGVDWENDETGMISFYKKVVAEDGGITYELVHSEEFHANSASGSYSATFPNGYEGTFDMVVFSAVQVEDHSDPGSIDDNSDYVIKDITFTPPYAGEASGEVSAHGADGVSGYGIDFDAAAELSCLTADGKEITFGEENGALVGYIDGQAVFTFSMDPDSGEWHYSQNGSFALEDGAKLEIPFTATDNDGDMVGGSVSIDGTNSQVHLATTGEETLTGGSGVADTFLWTEGTIADSRQVDAIEGFELGTDKIRIDGLADIIGGDYESLSDYLRAGVEDGSIAIFKSSYHADSCWTLRIGEDTWNSQFMDIFMDKDALSSNGDLAALADNVTTSGGSAEDQLALLNALFNANVS